MANAVLLLGVAMFILYEAIERLGDGAAVPGVPMIVVALAGLAANFVVALLLRSHSEAAAWPSRAPTWRSSPTPSAASAC